MPTLQDIATRCGVTKGTVSRVLNNYGEGFSVRPEVRDRILAAADDMNYQPNIAARTLKSNKTNLVAIVAASWVLEGSGINRSIIDNMIPELHAAGYDPCSCQPSPQHRNQQLPPWKVDGAVVFHDFPPGLKQELTRQKVPYICVNTAHPEDGACVLFDDRQGARLAVEALIERGHQRIAYLNADRCHQHYSCAQRHESYLETLAAHGLQPMGGHDVFAMDCDTFLKDVVLEEGATAVLVYDHTRGVELYQAAYRAGVRIPETLSVICFNDEYPVASMWPAISVVAIATDRIGRLVGRYLVALIEGKAEPEMICIPETLVLRESVGPPISRRRAHIGKIR